MITNSFFTTFIGIYTYNHHFNKNKHQSKVLQGSPLYPTVFILCQDFILKQITDQNIVDIHGFQITPELDNIIGMAFADDNIITYKEAISAVTVVDMMNQMFGNIGI